MMEILEKQKSKNKYGQYFTPEVVADFMIDLAEIDNSAKILEPSCGKGIFLKLLKDRGFMQISAFEIDSDLANEFDFVKYESFISSKIEGKYDLIIGNPPYIRWANLEEELKQELLHNALWNKYFNSLCDYLYIFILKSIELLEENGQLIFICPEYWLTTTHSLTLRNYMVMNGYFEEIYHFNETPIFDKVTVSIIIFRFRKSKNIKPFIPVTKFYANQKLTQKTLNSLKRKETLNDVEYLNVSQFKTNERWLLASDELKKELEIIELYAKKKHQNQTLLFKNDEKKLNYHTIGDICDIGNGLVSGLDKAFQLNGHALSDTEKKATLKVVKAKDLQQYFHTHITKYLFVTEGVEEEVFKSAYPHFYEHLQDFKEDLNKRYQYNRKINYWEWVFLRNFSLFKTPQKRIFVPCKERISNKNYFRFALVDSAVFPTQDVTAIFKKAQTKESIEYILAYLNNYRVFDWLKYNGIVKGNIVEFSEKPIASIPFRPIDWNNEKEVKIHDDIKNYCNEYLIDKSPDILKKINLLIDQLFN